MNDKFKLQHSDLVNHLKEQIEFLQTSAELYDKGHYKKAKMIATTIRIWRSAQYQI